MVVKRQCSFCAGEIEPGTGSMFVKRDGTVFHFCSSSCRKQQLHLGRVGHRLKWTRAHALKRAAEQSSPSAARAARRAESETAARTSPSIAKKTPGKPSATAEAPGTGPATVPKPVEPERAVVSEAKVPATESAARPDPGKDPKADDAVKKPRAKKPKAAPPKTDA